MTQTLRTIRTALLIAILPAAAAAQDESCARTYTGRLGFDQIDCNCSFSRDERDPDITNWFFRDEPRVGRIDPNGPASGKLHEGDVIAAINDAAITSRDGGRRFSRLTPGTPVMLTVRRGNERVEVTISPRDECGAFSSTWRGRSESALDAQTPAQRANEINRVNEINRLNAASADRNRARLAPGGMQHSRGWFGFGLSCSDCIMGGDHGNNWRFDQPPQIYQVDPGSPAEQARLRRGDVLTHIDTLALDSEAGAQRFASVEPGQVVSFRYRRGSQTGSVSMMAQEPPGAAAHQTRALAEFGALLESSRTQERQTLQQQRLAELELTRMQQQLGDRLREQEIEQAKRIHDQLTHHMDSTREARDQALNHLRGSRAEEDKRLQEILNARAQRGTTAATRQRLRYTGTIGSTDVEVRGIGSVIVTEDEQTGELVITTGEATIRLKPKK